MMKRLLLLISVVSLFAACGKDKTVCPLPEPHPVSRTYFMYMAGNNDLARVMNANIQALKDEGIKEKTLNGGRVIVYYNFKNSPAQILEIKYNKSLGKAEEVVLKEYAEFQNAVDPAVVRRVVEDMLELAPAQSYLIDFASHSLGWLPAKYTTLPSRAFGPVFGENGQYYEINIDVLAAQLPYGVFDAVLFDSCNMGCVESAYEFRGKTRYFVASVAEILDTGFPYANIGELFRSDRGLLESLEAFADVYVAENYKATLSIFDCSRLEGLAAATKAIVSDKTAELLALPLNLTGLTGAPVQYYFDGYASNYRPAFFDMRDMLAHPTITNGEGPLYSDLLTQLDRVVLYKKTTNTLFTTKYAFDPARFCGITMHSIATALDPDQTTLGWNTYYKTLSWYKEVWPQ